MLQDARASTDSFSGPAVHRTLRGVQPFSLQPEVFRNRHWLHPTLRHRQRSCSHDRRQRRALFLRCNITEHISSRSICSAESRSSQQATQTFDRECSNAHGASLSSSVSQSPVPPLPMTSLTRRASYGSAHQTTGSMLWSSVVYHRKRKAKVRVKIGWVTVGLLT